MIENIKIISGTPEHVEKKLQEYLSSHPKAEILSSSVASHPVEPAETAKPDSKAKAKAKAGEEAPEESEIGNQKSQISDKVTVCVIVGLRF